MQKSVCPPSVGSGHRAGSDGAMELGHPEVEQWASGHWMLGSEGTQRMRPPLPSAWVTITCYHHVTTVYSYTASKHHQPTFNKDQGIKYTDTALSN